MSHDSERFHGLVCHQIDAEFYGAHQYVATAAYFDSINMPQTAAVFYQHAAEEREHAMRFLQYLLNRGLQVNIGGVRDVVNNFTNPVEALTNAVKRELEITDQIFVLDETAREDKDPFAREFIQWFVREQIEEEALFKTLLDVATRAGDDWFAFEHYIARDVESAHAPGAPKIAGQR